MTSEGQLGCLFMVLPATGWGRRLFHQVILIFGHPARQRLRRLLLLRGPPPLQAVLSSIAGRVGAILLDGVIGEGGRPAGQLLAA